jgi:hypothetical protein
VAHYKQFSKTKEVLQIHHPQSNILWSRAVVLESTYQVASAEVGVQVVY